MIITNFTRGICFLLFSFLCTVNLGAQGFGKSEYLKKWFFNYGDVHLGGRQTLDHSGWQQVTVPHDWSVTFPASPDLFSCTGYLPGGVGWYRTNINIPVGDKENRYYLYFGGVYRNSEVFINGKWLGKRPNGYVSFAYEITPFVKPGQENVVAVRVDHSEQADSRWYTGSGIYRDVQLITAPKTHFDLWGIQYTTTVDANKAMLKVNATLNDGPASADFSILHEFLDANGKVVATTNTQVPQNQNKNEQLLNIEQPILWQLDNPYLYQLKSTLLKKGKITDVTYTTVGIRTINFDADNGFFLNGQNTNLKGVCLHHDAGVLGAAVPKVVWRERLVKLKDIGVNAIRMSHNPQSTDLYELCDELGFLVIDEAFDEWEYPKKKWLTGWNHGEPGFQGYASYFREWNKIDLASMVKRDRNHPSIIMWSIGNEVDYPNDPYSHPVLETGEIGQKFTRGYLTSQPHADRLGDIAKELVPVVKALDTSRPVTAALAGSVMSNETEFPETLDVVGYNYTEYQYDEDHKKYPKRIFYGSENRHDLNAWKAVRDKDFIFAQFLWTGIDYLGESGVWPSRGFNSGMVDMANYIKPKGYFRKSLWAKEPMLYIGAYPARKNGKLSMDAPAIWNFERGEDMTVACYTNTEKVDLYLNGAKVGKTKQYDDETGIITWQLPFTEGQLKAVGFTNGKPVAEMTLITSGKPDKLKLKPIQNTLSKAYDVAIYEVTVVDAKENICQLAANKIKVTIKGDGELMGIENGSNYVAENYLDNVHELNNGKAIIYVRATKDTGKIRLKIESAYLNVLTKEIDY